MKKKSMTYLVESLEYIKCYNLITPDLLKSKASISDTITGRSAYNREDLKPYWKSEKRTNFSRSSTSLLFTSFSKTFIATE